ncbi:hypothetical protein CON48_07230 [Bacillus thuringiensis]|uniref:Uncharacterized protein n=2 Tax=Bacillus thuringiensis TaxID=1428 RepID=A0A9X7P8H2_BACTU|nr:MULTISPECIES: hypothetical protein [Bacillus cereus group]MCU4776552.1 hypothetical protein [Bacillus cereus]MCU4807715.1 hypothetical protein [Bacillus cereus]MCU4813645.1 hypothetical protein [Bacillus cereus]MCU5087497.1 hypothetical protein [Bacillus cereus]MCU5120726.1 hypothetical protein [Bacillus cereus]
MICNTAVKWRLLWQKKKEAYYVHVYTLRDKSTKSVKIKPSRSLKEEMNVLALTDSDILLSQIVWYDPNKEDTKK